MYELHHLTTEALFHSTLVQEGFRKFLVPGRNIKHYFGISTKETPSKITRLKKTTKQGMNLTGPLIVPDPRRSPGLRLQPLTVWWASCCEIVQYLYHRDRNNVSIFNETLNRLLSENQDNISNSMTFSDFVIRRKTVAETVILQVLEVAFRDSIRVFLSSRFNENL